MSEDADGPRRIYEANWSGECLMCSKSKISKLFDGGKADVSGVYILVGPTKAESNSELVQFESELYVGQGDSVADRIQNHLLKKEFWQTAVVFYRPQSPLNAGTIKFLESKLISLSRSAGNCILNNAVTPNLPSLSEPDRADAEKFLNHVLFVLKAFGMDFFCKQQITPPEPVFELSVPDLLKPLVSSLKEALLDFPNTEVYSTKTPDCRAKVIHGDSFRVFARIALRTNGVKLELKDVGNFELASTSTIDTTLREQIALAYKLAEKYFD